MTTSVPASPVVLLHAGIAERTMWSEHLDPIAAAGDRVIAKDLPGFGEAPVAPEDAPWNDVVGTLDALSVDLRAPRRPARVDPGHLTAGRCPAVHRPPRAFKSPLHVEEALGPVCRERREVYATTPVEETETRFAHVHRDLRDRSPAMIATWKRASAEFVPLLEFPPRAAHHLYTTNPHA